MPSSFMRATLPPGASLLLRVDRPLKLLLVHARAALDSELARLVVELVARPALRPVGPRALPAALAGRLVVDRCARRPPRLPMLRALLVDRARGDLLRASGRAALLLLALDDVLVLAGALRALLHSARRHRSTS